MNLTIISALMDILIVILLMGTIYYAYSLTRQLKIFRQSRQEFESLLMQLTGQINTANESIDHMKEAAETNGQVLNKLIRDGKLLADELDIVNEASNNLANRLERAASLDRPDHRTIAQGTDEETYEDDRVEEASSSADSPKGFAIQDREVDDDDMSVGFDDSDDDVGHFHSQAERELFTALKRKS
jgi:sugar-specific transcriptional regulator TrmB